MAKLLALKEGLLVSFGREIDSLLIVVRMLLVSERSLCHS